MPLTSVPGPILVGVDHLRALGFANLLHDHLLGGLRQNASEGHRFHRLFDEAARFDVFVDVAGIVQAQFALGHFEFGRVVRKHLPAAERVVAAGLAVDRDAHVELLAVLFAGRGCQRGFERVEDNFLVDALLVGNRVDGHQNFFVHNPSTPRSLRPQSRLLNSIERQLVGLAVDFHYNRAA